jgi:hypothetical protein
LHDSIVSSAALLEYKYIQMTLIFSNFNMTHVKSPMTAAHRPALAAMLNATIQRHHDEKAALPALCCMHSSMSSLLCLHIYSHFEN